jgi:hypothetical protein
MRKDQAERTSVLLWKDYAASLTSLYLNRRSRCRAISCLSPFASRSSYRDALRASKFVTSR